MSAAPRCLGATETMFADDVRRAVKLCSRCALRPQCARGALERGETWGVWGGLTFEARLFQCPECGTGKDPAELACPDCWPNHVAKLRERQEHDPDIRLDPRARPSERDNPNCPLPRGAAHHTTLAYRRGCRCTGASAAMATAGKLSRDARKQRILHELPDQGRGVTAQPVPRVRRWVRLTVRSRGEVQAPGSTSDSGGACACSDSGRACSGG